MMTVVLDCDGVLTDGRQYIDSSGEKLFKAFHSRDIRAIREIVNYGVRVIVMTADDWPGAVAWCERVGAEFVYTRNKVETCVALGLDPKDTLMVGDDVWDKPLAEWCACAFCPQDADPELLRVITSKTQMWWGVLDAKGGQGCVASLVYVLRHEVSDEQAKL